MFNILSNLLRYLIEVTIHKLALHFNDELMFQEHFFHLFLADEAFEQYHIPLIGVRKQPL